MQYDMARTAAVRRMPDAPDEAVGPVEAAPVVPVAPVEAAPQAGIEAFRVRMQFEN